MNIDVSCRLRRSSLAAYCAVTLAFGAIASPLGDPAALAAPAQIAVEMTTVSKTRTGGGEIVVRGLVSDAASGCGVGGSPLTVEARVAAGKWKALATGKTRGSGRFAVRVTLAASAALRVSVGEDSGFDPASSAAAKVVVPQRVRVSAKSATSVDAGGAVDLEGWSSVGLRGRRVFLQVQAVDGWRNVGSARVTGAGLFSLTGRLDTVGRGQRLRVYAPGVPKLGVEAAVVGAGRVAVYGWYPLDAGRFERVDYFGLSDDASPRRIGGVGYPGSVALYARPGSEAFVTYALGGACSEVRFAAGVDDAATLGDGVAYSAAVDGDSRRLWTGDAAPGVSTPVRAQLDGALSITLRAWGSGVYHPQSSNHMVFGQAEVRCAP
jgi:hypothetical protein